MASVFSGPYRPDPADVVPLKQDLTSQFRASRPLLQGSKQPAAFSDECVNSKRERVHPHDQGDLDVLVFSIEANR